MSNFRPGDLILMEIPYRRNRQQETPRPGAVDKMAGYHQLKAGL